jgi:hypothetical protein
MLSGEGERLLDDFAVTGTSLLYCDRGAIGRGLTPTHSRAMEGIQGPEAGPPLPFLIREEGTGRGETSTSIRVELEQGPVE